jgi:hypothetical protein
MNANTACQMTRFLIVGLIFTVQLFTTAANVAVYDSVLALGTSTNKNYTFTDPATGTSVTITVTMTPGSSDPGDVFTLLDGNTRMAIGNPTINGDGNWIESGESVNFSATLLSVSAGVDTNSVRFGVAGIGIRPNSSANWTSSSGSKFLLLSNEVFYPLDTTTFSLAGTTYTGVLTGGGQLSNRDALAGQSIGFNASFSAISLSAGTQISGNPSDTPPSLSFIDTNDVVLAANFGGADLVRDGIRFISVGASGNPISTNFGDTSVTISAPGNLAATTFGDALFGSFIWADNQNEMSVEVSGLATNKSYDVYYLAGDSRALAFNMFLTLTASSSVDTNSTLGTMSWGALSSNNQYYIYLPVAVSNATTLNAKMTKNGDSAGVAFSGVLVVDTSETMPEVSVHPVDQTSCSNQVVAFISTAQGKPSPTQQWQCSPDGGNLFTNIVGATNSTLSFTCAGNEEGYQYRAVFTNSAGSATSDAATLSLASLAPPTITLDGASVCASSGGNIANGPSGMNGYFWTINNGSIVFGSYTQQSVTYNAGAEGVVTLTLFATNAGGCTVSNSIEVPIAPIPNGGIIIGGPVCAGSSTNTATAGTPDMTYAWTISNGTITSATNARTITFSTGASGVVGLGLLITSSAGCSSGDYAEFAIEAVPTATILTSSNAVANSTENNASGPAGAANYAWSISNGTITSATNIQSITYTAGSSGSVSLALTVRNAAGCTASTLTQVSIIAPPVIADQRLTSWITNTSGQYVRLYTNTAARNAGVTVTSWTFSSINGTNVTGSQTNPVYSGVQNIYSSSNWVYIRSSAMPAGPIGPLLRYAPAALLLPYNQKALYRFPRTPAFTSAKTLTGGGAIGYLIDGVQMFDTRDALSWNGTSESTGTGYWTRDAYVNEGYGFDPYQGHAAPGGAYHYHSNPQGLRYVLGDHVDFNPATKIYSESTTPVTKHSPILGWVRDGYPLYGPYGYSSASNSASGIRRMISGYVLRDGNNGTANLTAVGRTNIPPWAQRLYGISNASGPSVASYGPLGRYLEDSDYLGDLINPNTSSPFVKGVDFDLDEYNGRWCVTPEFPDGTYAYFVTINADGTPKYPYYIGRAFFGTTQGGTVSSISETVVTNFTGGTNMPLKVNTPTVANNVATLTWSAVEGGTYKVETSTDFSTWTPATTNARPQLTVGAHTNSAPEAYKLFRITRTAVAPFDPVNTNTVSGGGSSGTGILNVSPASAARGTTFTLTINLDPAVNPPPQAALVTGVTVGAINGASNVHVSQTQVTSSITIPAGAATGSQTVTVTFPPPPGQVTNTVYTLPNGFTIQ